MNPASGATAQSSRSLSGAEPTTLRLCDCAMETSPSPFGTVPFKVVFEFHVEANLRLLHHVF